MISKWSGKQDLKLRQAVEKYGTQWVLISRRYRFDRSINSLVKRWHGTLKDGVNSKREQSEDKVKQSQMSESSPKKKRIKRKGHKKTIFGRIKRRSAKPKPQTQLQEPKQSEPVERMEESESEQSQKEQQSPSQKEEREQRNSESDEDIIESLSSDDHRLSSLDVFMYKDRIMNLLLGEGLLDWEKVADRLGLDADMAPVLKKKWEKELYGDLKKAHKKGGCVKYSEKEDIILRYGIQQQLSNRKLLEFLPGRSLYSVDARRRRSITTQESRPSIVSVAEYMHKKMVSDAIKFLHKRHQHLPKPHSEDEYFSEVSC